VSRIAERSRLYRLEPAGLGTRQVEALTSYLMRLAAAHHLTPGALIGAALPELAGVSAGNRQRLVGEVSANGRSANGLSGVAAIWLAAVSAATLREDLAELTFVPWAEAISPVHLLRAEAAHCPACLQEMAERGTVYEPLAWSVVAIEICPVHRRPLAMACRDCGSSQFAFRWLGRPGLCRRCGAWLGTFELGPAQGLDRDRVNASLAAAGLLGTSPLPGTGANGISSSMAFLREILSTSQSDVARAIGTSKAAVSSWEDGSVRPSLPAVLAMCAHWAIDPAAFLAGIIEPGARYAPQPSPRIDRPGIDWAAIEASAQLRLSVDPPPTVGSVADSLGVSTTALRMRLPKVVGRLVARRREWRHREAVRRMERWRGEVWRRTTWNLERGRSASRRDIERVLPRWVQLREGGLADAWHAAHREFLSRRAGLAEGQTAASVPSANEVMSLWRTSDCRVATHELYRSN